MKSECPPESVDNITPVLSHGPPRPRVLPRDLPCHSDWDVIRTSHPHEKLQASTVGWNVPVPNEGEAKLSYRIRVRF